jgi:hypothetical protein
MAYHSGTAGVLGWCCGTPAILFWPMQFVRTFRIWQNMLSIQNYSCSITLEHSFSMPLERTAKTMTRLEFTKNAIIETVSDIADEQLLDYIYTVLMTALVAGTHPEAC